MLFWIIVAILLVLAVAGILSVLYRTDLRADGDTRAYNIQIARERLKELESERGSGVISDETFAQAKEELELVLLDDVQPVADASKKASIAPKAGVILAGVMVPLVALALYLALGAPQHLDVKGPATSDVHAGAEGDTPTMEQLLTGLQEKLKATPDDPEGWFMLGRVYGTMQRYQEAAQAYQKLAELTDNHPTALISWADSLAMAADGKVSGKPFELVRQVLEVEPDNIAALWLAGKGSVELGDSQNALYYWRRAEAGLSSEPEMLQEIQRLIAGLKDQASNKGMQLDDPGPSAPASQPSLDTSAAVQIEVSVAPELADRVQPGDLLFVFARMPDGPPMPIAAIKQEASSLPATILLDDSRVLSGGKLTDYPQLKIAARISKSGQPRATSGDLQSKDQIINPAEGGALSLVIDQVVP